MAVDYIKTANDCVAYPTFKNALWKKKLDKVGDFHGYPEKNKSFMYFKAQDCGPS